MPGALERWEARSRRLLWVRPSSEEALQFAHASVLIADANSLLGLQLDAPEAGGQTMTACRTHRSFSE
jgi:hypothetical protein